MSANDVEVLVVHTKDGKQFIQGTDMVTGQLVLTQYKYDAYRLPVSDFYQAHRLAKLIGGVFNTFNPLTGVVGGG